jgi:hypothetical protein
MLYQVDDALLHAMSGIELSRVRTELRLLLPEAINKSLIASRGADIGETGAQSPDKSTLQKLLD